MTIRAKWYICIAAACEGGWIHIGASDVASEFDCGVENEPATRMGSKETGRQRFQASNIRINVAPASMYSVMLCSLGVAANCTCYKLDLY